MQNNTKNPPWARSNVNSNISGINPQLMDPNMAMGQQGILPYQQGYNANLLQAQGAMSMPITGQMSMNQIGQGQMYGSNVVSYPTPRAMNPGMYGNAQQPSTNEQRVFTGTVTKTHNDFGFVDHDVFYQTSVCSKGQIPKVNDRVLVEATYNPNMPFKWNATRVQVLPKNSDNNSKPPRQNAPKSSNYNAVPPPSKRNSTPVSRRDDRPPPPRREERKRSRTRSPAGSRDRKDSRRRDSPPRKRPVVHSSPPPSNRGYVVRVPRIPLDITSLDVPSLNHRYTNLYIPSDFFAARVRWTETFPLQSPFPLNNPCSYHIMHKEAESPVPNDAVLEPADADYRFYAKVMLISLPALEDLYKMCGLTKSDEKEKDKDKRSSSSKSQHPTRLVKFLVGQKGKNGENFAIGGPWSPSLDGENPEKDPSVLVKTAIRTCKALTGIDLSNCTQWYRMVEYHYWRESTSSGKSRLETVVLFLPDVWSTLAARSLWPEVLDTYKSACDAAIRQLEEPPSTIVTTTADGGAGGGDQDKSQIDTILEDSTITIDENDEDEEKPEPTHFSKIDLKTIKVTNLRDELRARGASCKGLRSALVSRLSKLLKEEEAANSNTDGDEVMIVEGGEKKIPEDAEQAKPDEAKPAEVTNDEGDKTKEIAVEIVVEKVTDNKKEEKKEKVKTEKEIEEEKKKLEKEKQILKSRYELPSSPCILVHPSSTAKGGKFNCTVASLSVLLDYRIADNKEHSFELFVFAELFNEMMMRDFGFYIYKTLYTLPEKIEEIKEKSEKKDDKAEKKEDKSDKKDDKADKTDEKSDKKEDKKDDKSDNKKDDKRDSRRRDRKDSTDDERSSSPRQKSRGVDLPADPYLLLSLIYFDTSRCNYINKKDLQNLFACLGLQLSRAQIRAIVDKACVRDSFNFKSLAQAIKDLSSGNNEMLQDMPLDNVAAPSENNVEETPVDTQVTELEEAIATGNRHLVPVFGRKSDTDGAADNAGPIEIGDEGMVTYKSRLVAVGATLAALARSEAARARLETALGEARAVARTMRAAAAQTQQASKGAHAQLSDLTDQLARANARVTSLTASSKIFHSTLKNIQSKVEAVINIKFEEDTNSELVNGPSKTEKKEQKQEETKEMKPEINDNSDIKPLEDKDEIKEIDPTKTKIQKEIKTSDCGAEDKKVEEENVSAEVAMDLE